MSTALREIIARFGIQFDDTALKKGDKAVDGLADKLANMGKLLAGGIVLNGIKNMIFGLAEQADVLAKQSAALGISTDELQQWQHAAALSGASAEEFAGAFTKFNKNVADAAAGTGPAADALRTLGVKVKDASGNLAKPIDLLDGVAAGLEKLKNPAERTQAIMSLFGKSGAKLIPLFDQGAEGIAKMRAEVEELGGGFSPDFAKRSEAMNDAITRLNMAWLSFKVRVGGLAIPLIERFTVLATKVTAKVTKWVDQTGILGEKSNLAAAAAVVLGVAFFRAGLRAIIPWLPMIAAVAAIILLVDELITLWEGGDTLIGRAIDSIFGEGSSAKAVAWVKTVVEEIERFFATWESSTAEVKAGVELMFFDLGAAIVGVATSIQDAFARAWNGILDGATAMVSKVSSVFEKLPGGSAIVKTLASAQASIQSARANDTNRATADSDAAQGRRMFLDRADAAKQAQKDQIQAVQDDAARAQVIQQISTRVGQPINVNQETPITINFPPGTPPKDAKQMAEIVQRAQRDAHKSNAATIKQVAHTGG